MSCEKILKMSGEIIKRERLIGLDSDNPPVCTLAVLEEFSQRKIADELVIKFLRLYNRVENGEDVGNDYPELIGRIFDSLRIVVDDIRVGKSEEMNVILSRLKKENIGLVIETSSEHVMGVRESDRRNRFCLYGVVPVNMRDVHFLGEGIFNLLYKDGSEPNVSIITRKK